MKIFKLLFPKHHRALVQLGQNQKELEGICMEQIQQIQELESKVEQLDYEKEDLEIELEEEKRNNKFLDEQLGKYQEKFHDAYEDFDKQLDRCAGLENELENLEVELENTKTELTLKEQEVYDLQFQLGNLQDELDAQREEF